MKLKFQIILIGLISLFIQIQPILKSSKIEGSKFGQPLIITLFIGVVAFLFTKFRNKLYSLIVFVLAPCILILIYSRVIALTLLISLFIILSMILIGALFNIQSNLTRFIFGYSFLGFVLNIPNLYNKINLFYFYTCITSALIIMYIYNYRYIYISIKSFISSVLKSSDFFGNFAIYFYFIYFLFCSFVLGYTFDDLNHYIYISLKSWYFNFSQVSPYIPGSMAFQSLHNLSFLTYIMYFTPSDFLYATFGLKAWNFLCIFFSIIFLYSDVRKIDLEIAHPLMAILVSLPLLAVEILGNYTDFPLFLISFYVIYILVKKNYELKLIEPNLLEYTIFGLMAAVTLKTLVITIPIILIGLWNFRYSIKSYFYVAYSTFPTIILFTRNYLLTGNPTFPAGNYLWKSPFFDINKTSVTHKFVTDWNADISMPFNLIAGGHNSIGFYAAGPTFYGVLIPTLFLFLLLYLVYAYKININTIKFDYINILTVSKIAIYSFVLIVFLISPTHRYFIPFICLFALALSIFYKPFLKCSKLAALFLLLLVFCNSILGLSTTYNGAPYSYVSGYLYSEHSNRNWREKIQFYENANKEILISPNNKILIFYLQDKIFIKSPYVYEMDWYDYLVQKDLNDHHISQPNLVPGKNVVRHMCDLNFSYVILGKDNVFFDADASKFLDLLVPGLQQNLFRLNCSNFFKNSSIN